MYEFKNTLAFTSMEHTQLIPKVIECKFSMPLVLRMF